MEHHELKPGEKPIMVKVIDFTTPDVADSMVKFHEAHKAERKAAGKDATGTRLKPGYSWAYVDTDDGLFALCDEGVGPDYPITNEQGKRLKVDLYEEYDKDSNGHTAIGMMPIGQIVFTADEIREMDVQLEVPLHQFIRKFGSRLECNYYNWKKVLSKAAK